LRSAWSYRYHEVAAPGIKSPGEAMFRFLSSFRVFAIALAALALAACGSTQYIMSTKEGRLLVSHGKPKLDEQTGNYVFEDSEGRKTSIPKSEIVQVMER
jgi:Bacterial protein of unknown function (DUF903)